MANFRAGRRVGIRFKDVGPNTVDGLGAKE